MPDTPPQPKRALITYRTKELKDAAKWTAWREREIAEAKDFDDAMGQFYERFTWPAMTGAIEVKEVSWLDED